MFKIVVYYSSECNTCFDHINRIKKHFKIEQVDVSAKPELYDLLDIDFTPTTIVLKHDVEVFRKEGMMFDSQMDEMRKVLK